MSINLLSGRLFSIMSGGCGNSENRIILNFEITFNLLILICLIEKAFKVIIISNHDCLVTILVIIEKCNSRNPKKTQKFLESIFYKKTSNIAARRTFS